MFQIGKKNKAFSLIEIVVSLALFSMIMTAVITVTISVANAQRNIQTKLFLVQTAQTTIEGISRQLRYGYNFSGSTQNNYSLTNQGQTIFFNVNDVSNTSGSSGTSTQVLYNALNSPYILFESQTGNPSIFTDQNAFCFHEDKLYKITSFSPESNNLSYSSLCSSGSPVLPDSIILEKVSFDIFNGTSAIPKNPMVRINLKMRHIDGESIEIQTTVTQRLVTYF